MENMPTPRHGADGVLLPNGKIMVVNGAQEGYMAGSISGGSGARNSQTCAWEYDPEADVGNGHVSGRFTVLACRCVFSCHDGAGR